MIDFCVNAAKHYRQAAEVAKQIKVTCPQPDNIVVAGLGGSAIGGELLKDWSQNKLIVPIEIMQGLQFTRIRGQKNLGSGFQLLRRHRRNIRRFLDALKRGCMMFCITSGGDVLKAQKHKVPYLQVPGECLPAQRYPTC